MIRTALERYNMAATAMVPPCRQLRWDEVVEYMFLSEFDLLCDTRQDVSHHPWTTPAGQQAMDSYFKRRHAKEEIARLNIEIRRLVTYIKDEEHYLRACEDALKVQHPGLAHQISIKRNIRGHFHRSHIQTLHTISQLLGFSGMLSPGQSNRTGLDESGSSPVPIIPSFLCCPQPPQRFPGTELIVDDEEGLEDEADADEGVEEASHTLQAMFIACCDKADSMEPFSD